MYTSVCIYFRQILEINNKFKVIFFKVEIRFEHTEKFTHILQILI